MFFAAQTHRQPLLLRKLDLTLLREGLIIFFTLDIVEGEVVKVVKNTKLLVEQERRFSVRNFCHVVCGDRKRQNKVILSCRSIF